MELEDLKQDFINEALQLINKIEELLLELDDRSADQGEIQEIFRVMHTLKGSAGMFAFNNTQEIGHKLEDIYELIREDKLELSKDILSVTLEAIDIIKVLLNTDDRLISPDFDNVMAKINGLTPACNENLGNKDCLISGMPGMQLSQKKARSGHKWFFIRFIPNKDILLRGVSPVNVFEELQNLGKVEGYPVLDKVPLLKDFDVSLLYLSWDIFIYTDCSFHEIEDCFLFYEPGEFKIIEIDQNSLENNEQLLTHCNHLANQKITVEQLNELLNISNVVDKVSPTHDNEKVKHKTDQPGINDSTKEITTINVNAQKLDELINLVSELVTINSRMQLYEAEIEHEGLSSAVKIVTRLSKRFRDNALNLRLIPVKVLVVKMRRLIHTVCKELGKEVEFITNGTNTELDKNIISKLDKLLIHIVRNSIDHGLETPEERLALNKPRRGVIRFISFYSGSNVFIQIQDDGRGIDPERVRQKAIEKGLLSESDKLSDQDVLNLLFSPGFTTADTVSNISGRGVGLDVVRKEISNMRGEIDIESEKGLGTSFTLKLPLTLSIIDTLMVNVNGTKVLLPRDNIVHTELVKYNHIELGGKMEYKGKVIPVISLPGEFSNQLSPKNNECCVVISQNDKLYAIMVNRIIGEHQAVVKPLGYYTQNHKYFSGASILGDGTLAFILDINKVLNAKRNKTTIGEYNLR